MSHHSLHADAVSVLSGWQQPNHSQAAIRESFLTLLAARADATARECAPGHLTASVFVLSADLSRVLLTLHKRALRWFQLGGHCEPADETMADAARREAAEESGIPGLLLDPVPVSLDVHPITCSSGVPTRHFDVRYVAVAPAGASAVISEESADLRFFGLTDLPAGVDEGIRESLAWAVRRGALL